MALVEVEVFEWRNDKWQESIYQVQELAQKPFTSTNCGIAFVDTKALSWNGSGSPGPWFDSFNVPSWFWTPLYLESNGFFSALENGSESNGDRVYNTFFRFLSKHASSRPYRTDSCGSDIVYKWDKLSFCTQWRSPQCSFLLCFDTPDAVRDNIKHALITENTKIPTSTPFGFHAFLLQFIVHNFDSAVWSCRDLIRGLEHSRPEVQNPKLDYVRMHEIARHAIHSTEMLGTSLNVVDSMLVELQKRWVSTLSGSETTAVERDFNFHKTTLKCLQLRSQALEERLRNEINLAFHIGSQYESIISARIAEAAQRDGMTMKTISVLGLVFLPGTLISSIFGMSFFDYTPTSSSTVEHKQVSDKFWIYWAVTAPITVFVLIVWLIWQLVVTQRARQNSPRPVGHPLDDQERKLGLKQS